MTLSDTIEYTDFEEIPPLDTTSFLSVDKETPLDNPTKTDELVTVMVFMREGQIPYFTKEVPIHVYKAAQLALRAGVKNGFVTFEDDTGINSLPVENIAMISVTTKKNMENLYKKVEDQRLKNKVRQNFSIPGEVTVLN